MRTDPYERADQTSNTYWDWFIDRNYIAGYATVTRVGPNCQSALYASVCNRSGCCLASGERAIWASDFVGNDPPRPSRGG